MEKINVHGLQSVLTAYKIEIFFLLKLSKAYNPCSLFINRE